MKIYAARNFYLKYYERDVYISKKYALVESVPDVFLNKSQGLINLKIIR